jgi:hypothetical protein
MIRTIGAMSPLDQIRESIETRIAELKAEITALQAARSALHRERAGSTASAAAPVTQSRRRRTPKGTSNGRGAASEKETGEGTGATAAVAGAGKPSTKSVGQPPKPRARKQTKPAKSAKPVEVLLAGKLEAMLGEAEEGLSAITISKRSNASYNQVLGLLRTLDSAGQVRRTGTRRTSRWRLVTDEERIAERAAELERRSLARSGRSPAQH